MQGSKGGSYKIKNFAKETARCNVSVKVNGKHVHGSPFVVQVRTRQFRQVSFPLWWNSVPRRTDITVGKPWGTAMNESDEITVTVNGYNLV